MYSVGICNRDLDWENQVVGFYEPISSVRQVACCDDFGTCLTFCQDLTFDWLQSNVLCEQTGMRLCSKDQLDDGLCCDWANSPSCQGRVHTSAILSSNTLATVWLEAVLKMEKTAFLEGFVDRLKKALKKCLFF